MLAAWAPAIAPVGCLGIRADDARLSNTVEDGWEQFETARHAPLPPDLGSAGGRISTTAIRPTSLPSTTTGTDAPEL